MNLENRDSTKGPEIKSTGPVYWFLRLFTVVHPGEALTAVLLMFNVFLLLAAYYIIKPVREALILAGKREDC